ncbi:DUF4097 family beta strand repeat-containing protein [Paenibacillus sp. HB172176]|uniref:DUF4097 family beta strand repeat-containing protein n=1 Tax=Paenibacillus sp. HB172176 TaxID=2493690 RepID=UPI00143A6F99|nr:DUF4097 family beta strand repeat-containing protein [Paenibacillus sp. HB172176]
MKRRIKLGTILIIIGMIGILYAIVSGGKSPLAGLSSFFMTDVNQERTIDVSEAEELVINSKSINVEVVQGTGAEALVAIKGKASKNIANQLKINAEQSGNQLTIDPNQPKGISFGFIGNQVTMTVALPEKQWKQVQLEISSGNLVLEQLSSEAISIDAGSGNVAIADSELDSLSIDQGSGNMKLSNVRANTMDLDNSSGNTKLEDYYAEHIKFHSGSGNVAISNGEGGISGNAGSGNIVVTTDDITQDTDLKAGSGNITIKLNHAPESLAVSYDGGSGDGDILLDGFSYHGEHHHDSFEGVFGSGETTLKVRTGSGNFTLK